MAKGHYQHEIPIDLKAELPLQPLGKGPLLPESVKRQPYDELYVKQKASRDYWSRN